MLHNIRMRCFIHINYNILYKQNIRQEKYLVILVMNHFGKLNLTFEELILSNCQKFEPEVGKLNLTFEELILSNCQKFEPEVGKLNLTFEELILSNCQKFEPEVGKLNLAISSKNYQLSNLILSYFLLIRYLISVE